MLNILLTFIKKKKSNSSKVFQQGLDIFQKKNKINKNVWYSTKYERRQCAVPQM